MLSIFGSGVSAMPDLEYRVVEGADRRRLVLEPNAVADPLGRVVRIVSPFRMLGQAALGVFEQLADRLTPGFMRSMIS